MQDERIESALAGVAEIEEAKGKPPEVVEISYFHSQADYDKFGRDEGAYTIANANSRAVAIALESAGYDVSFRYPNENSDGFTLPKGQA